jgi:hypothetical protein
MQTQFELFAAEYPLVRDPSTYWQRYRAYLKSYIWWHVVRPMTFKNADYKCQAGKPGCTGVAEECHHRTYLFWSRCMDRPGVTTVAVCRNCHRWIHSHPRMTADNDNQLPLDYAA